MDARERTGGPGHPRITLRRTGNQHADVPHASETHGLAVGTFLRSGEVTVVELEDELAPPELGGQAVASDGPMAARFELVDDRSRHIVLELDVHLVVKAKARSIRRRLRILMVVRKPDHDLRVSLRLDRA